MKFSPWNDDLKDRLRVAYADGYSAAQIAVILGCGFSRNAIIGQIHRLGLAPPAVLKWKQAPRRAQASRQRYIPGTNRFYEAVSNPAEIKLRCVEIVPRGLILLDLEPGDCRYPYGDETITFCGHPKQEGSQYCTPHHHLCWVKPIVQIKAPTFRPYAMGAA